MRDGRRADLVVGGWGQDVVGAGAVRTELSHAQAAIDEARDALRCAATVSWQSTAADEFRRRLHDLSMSVSGHAHVVREALGAAARLEVL